MDSWRRIATRNNRAKGDNIVMTMPNVDHMPFDDELISLCYDMWSLADFQGMPPHPLLVLDYPSGFIDQLLAYHQGVRFYEDSQRRGTKVAE